MAEDIVERLLQFHQEIVESDGGESPQMAMTREAAEEISRLRGVEEDHAQAGEIIIELKQEIERLQRAHTIRLQHICPKCGVRHGGERDDVRF